MMGMQMGMQMGMRAAGLTGMPMDGVMPNPMMQMMGMGKMPSMRSIRKMQKMMAQLGGGSSSSSDSSSSEDLSPPKALAIKDKADKDDGEELTGQSNRKRGGAQQR